MARQNVRRHAGRIARLSTGAAAIALTAQFATAGAAFADDAAVTEQLEQFRARLERQEEELAEARRRLDSQQNRIIQQTRWIESQADLLSNQRTEVRDRRGAYGVYTQPVPAVLRAARVAGADGRGYAGRFGDAELLLIQAEDGGGSGGGGDDGTGERPNSERATDQLLVDAGGVLLPRNTLQVEPGLNYTHVSSNRVNIDGFTVFNALVVGEITVDEISRDFFGSTMTARYGVGGRMQVEARLPVQHRNDIELQQIGTNDQREVRTDNFDWGDAEATFSWQPFAQDGARPATIARIRMRAPTGASPFSIEQVAVVDENGEQRGVRLAESPTGSGFWAAGPSATFVWRADPLVYFAGGGYIANFNRNLGEQDARVHINPGDTVDVFGGFNLALNERVSINTAFSVQHTFETSTNGDGVIGSAANDARLSFGTSIGVSDRVSVVLSTAAGLTDESPDYTFGVSIPVTFADVF